MTDVYYDKTIQPGDFISKFAHKINQATYQNSPAVEVFSDPSGNFRGDVGYVFEKHILELMMERRKTPNGPRPIMWESQETDGGGHKPEYSAFLGLPEFFGNLPQDIIVMNDHDILRRGGLPLIFTNFMDIKQITSENVHLAQAMLEGFGRIMKENNYVSLTGESAIMRYGVTAFCETNNPRQLILNWAANCTGVYHLDKYISGTEVKSKMWIVGFWEPGMRCNGSTWFINLLLMIYGSIEKLLASNKAMEFIKKLAVKSESYVKTILRLHGWNYDGTIRDCMVKIMALYHITGGGIWGKINLPPGVGAYFYNMPNPADVLLEAQEMAWGTELHMSDWKAHRSLHGGIGMAAVLESQEAAEIVIAEAKKDGVQAQIIGETTIDDESVIKVESKFKEGKILFSNKPE